VLVVQLHLVMVLVNNLLLDQIHNTKLWVTAIIIAKWTLFCTQKLEMHLLGPERLLQTL